MYDKPEELLQRIRLGEDSFLELKQVTFKGEKIAGPARDAIADELAAIANTRGGVLVLGVDDKSREIAGIPLEKLDAVEAYVREVCNDSVAPPVTIRTLRMTLPDGVGESRPVLKVDVPRSLFVHKSPGGYFHRQGSSKREMSPDLLARLFQQRSQSRLIRFDEQIVAGASLSDLVPELRRRFRSDLTRDTEEDHLRKLGMLRRDEDGAWRPTVVGVLIAAEDPRAWLPNAFIQAVAYRGTSSVPEGPSALYQLDARDVTGPVDEQVLSACRFVHRNMKIAATKDLGRHDIPQFDLGAVFEAVVNAVAHRDYSIYGSKIRLRMYADRLEICSPGTIPNAMTVDSLAFRQAARNETLTSLLAKCPVPDLEWLGTGRRTLMDRRGEGVPLILERSERLSGKRPEYRLVDDAELQLTIWAAGS
jgi:ATP-dependent DNA helicase RecG